MSHIMHMSQNLFSNKKQFFLDACHQKQLHICYIKTAALQVITNKEKKSMHYFEENLINTFSYFYFINENLVYYLNFIDT